MDVLHVAEQVLAIDCSGAMPDGETPCHGLTTFCRVQTAQERLSNPVVAKEVRFASLRSRNHHRPCPKTCSGLSCRPLPSAQASPQGSRQVHHFDPTIDRTWRSNVRVGRRRLSSFISVSVGTFARVDPLERLESRTRPLRHRRIETRSKIYWVRCITAYARHGRHRSVSTSNSAEILPGFDPAFKRLNSDSFNGNASGSPNARMAI